MHLAQYLQLNEKKAIDLAVALSNRFGKSIGACRVRVHRFVTGKGRPNEDEMAFIYEWSNRAVDANAFYNLTLPQKLSKPPKEARP